MSPLFSVSLSVAIFLSLFFLCGFSQYINGVSSYMDVLDAQRELLSAQLGLNSAVCGELLSVVYLYKALGGGY